MGTNSFIPKNTGEIVQADHINEIHASLDNDIVPRATGLPTDNAGSLGTSTFNFKNLFIKENIFINNQLVNLNTTNGSPFKILNGESYSDGAPNFLQLHSGNSVKIIGTSTQLNLLIASQSVGINADIIVSSLSTAPSANNTCVLNDPSFIGQDFTKYVGEYEREYLTIDSIGSEISSLDGTVQVFKIGAEFFLAYVDTANDRLYAFKRGIGHTERKLLNDNETITLYKLNAIFLDQNGVSVYKTILYPKQQPADPITGTSGEFYFNTQSMTWRKYSGSAWETTNAIFLGIAICDTANAVLIECEDYDKNYNAVSVGTIEYISSTKILLKTKALSINAVTHSLFTERGYEIDMSTHMESGVSETAGTYYYIYASDNLQFYFSNKRPRRNDKRLGAYHPYKYWRYIGQVYNDLDSNISNFVKINFQNDFVKNSLEFIQGTSTFKTNFSIDRLIRANVPSDNDAFKTQFIDYGFRFDSIIPSLTRLQDCFTIGISPNSPEIQYTGTWSDNIASNYSFGLSKTSSTANDFLTFDFEGSCVGVIMNVYIDQGLFSTELSDDDGITWKYRKNHTSYTANSGVSNGTNYRLYENLEIKTYKVKLTVLSNASGVSTIRFSGAYYSIYGVLSDCKQHYYEATEIKTLDDLPPCTHLLVGTWFTNTPIFNESQNGSWGGVHMITGTAGDYLKFRFYGKRAWFHYIPLTNVTLNITIDGSTSSVLNPNFSMIAVGSSEVNACLRLDNGTLIDGWHDVKITIASVTGGAHFRSSGFIHSADSYDSTVTRSLITGDKSELIHFHDSRITKNGSWTITSSQNYIGIASTYTINNGDSIAITTPNDSTLKAIYGIFTMNIDRGIIEATLGASQSRFLNLDTSNFISYNEMFLLYDSHKDGSLANKELKIYKRGGTQGEILGVIFEYGEIATESGVTVIQKNNRWTHNGVTVYTGMPNTYRLDVTGVRSDFSSERKPYIFTPYIEQQAWLNFGLPLNINDGVMVLYRNSSGYNSNGYSAGIQTIDHYAYFGRLASNFKTIQGAAAIGWHKLGMFLSKVW